MLFIACVAFAGCSEEEVAECCKTVIATNYTIQTQQPYLGGKIWTATYLDCNQGVTVVELNNGYPLTSPNVNVGDIECD